MANELNLADYTWHALYCPPNKELDTGHRLSARGYKAIIPAEKDWLDKRGHTRETYRPVLPRYVFTGFSEAPNWEYLREIVPAVQGYLHFGGGPAKMKLADMEWALDLQERFRGRVKPAPFHDTIKIGDEVRIAKGPLMGTRLKVDAIVAKEIHTFREFLGTLRVFKIPLANLEPV